MLLMLEQAANGLPLVMTIPHVPSVTVISLVSHATGHAMGHAMIAPSPAPSSGAIVPLFALAFHLFKLHQRSLGFFGKL